MKAIMGFGFFLLFLAGIALVMLQGREMARKNVSGGGAGITGIEWRPRVIGAETIPSDSGLFVTFELDGGIKGHGGCNSLFGSLHMAADELSVGEIGATRMACREAVMDREAAFIAALQATTRFAVAENSLQLLGERNLLLAELVPVD